MAAPLDVYDGALRGAGRRAPLHAVDERGAVARLPVRRWLAPPSRGEEELLAGLPGPVLDVGCGAGRHVAWLRSRGVDALGVDPSPVAVELARRRGALVLEGSIFGPVPEPGRWAAALLVDGNIGIGGDPERLLGRIGQLLASEGQILVEVEGAGGGITDLRLAHRGVVSAAFRWARVGVADLRERAHAAGFEVAEQRRVEGRWFVRLARRRP